MRALYVIIMTAFWCNIFYFVTSCVSYSKPPPEITSTSINDDNKKSKNYYHSILISKNVYPFNNFFSYDEGDNATISFETDYTSFYMKWIQKMDNQIIMEGSENTDHNTLIQMIISRFDNGTTFQCFVYQAYGGDNRYSRLLGQSGIITINVRNTTSYETRAAISEETVPYYDHTKLTCSGVNYKKWIKLSKDGLIEKVQNATLLSHQRGLDELILSLSLNETFNNSKYMCSGMTYSIGYHKREIVKLVHLVYDPMKSYDIESYSTEATELTDMKFILSNNIPLIAGVAGVVAVIFLIALIYLCLRKKKPRRPAPHEVETYACPSTVQYVQVQTVSTKSNRRLVKDDTPYARIIGCIEPAARR